VSQTSLSEQLLPGNACFGCGQENPHGLRITIFTDPARPDHLRGEFDPQAHMIGFPGITHGGAIYTALDCMATWSGMVLRKTKAMWLLRSATMTYHRPAMQGRPISLSATIEEEGEEWQAIRVRAEARNAEGELLAGGVFKVIPVPPEKFKAMAGVAKLPDGWAQWVADGLA
jgi:acyl-coenzyme A thioesterase PaaI-like protein